MDQGRRVRRWTDGQDTYKLTVSANRLRRMEAAQRLRRILTVFLEISVDYWGMGQEKMAF